MLISYSALVNTIFEGGIVKNMLLENINGTSIDIRLGDALLVEKHPTPSCPGCKVELREQDDLDLKSRSDRNQRVHCPNCFLDFPYCDSFTAIDISKKQPLDMMKVSCVEGYKLWPGEGVLAPSMEVFYLPSYITAEYRLKSSMARVFLEHLHSGWCDPMWQGSVLTLELVNMNKYHPLTLKAGMKIGQMCFYKHDPVPLDKSYATRGQYNNDLGVTASKGSR